MQRDFEKHAMTVELLQHHTHAGVLHPPGSRIELPEDSARWLIEAGIARAVEPESKKPNRKE